jgi:hypothetical protein
MVFSIGAAPRIYNGDLKHLRGELKEYFEMAVGDY